MEHLSVEPHPFIAVAEHEDTTDPWMVFAALCLIAAVGVVLLIAAAPAVVWMLGTPVVAAVWSLT